MITSISFQTILFFKSLILGIIFGVNYDFFRAIRREFHFKFIGVFICDTFFWCINLIAFLIFILNFANGEGRIYILVAIILGNIFYFLTISFIFLKIFRVIFNTIFYILYNIILLLKNIAKKSKKIFKKAF